MSIKWNSESGILRKSEFKEKKEELFVFGYSCKLFRDDDKALLIDQGRHLIPWMGDETLKIDRYDARGALHDLSALEAPPGGYDWRVELTKAELDVEQLCDEERYRALHTDEDEEEMYREEELKRLHAAGYGQVGFNYDAPKEPEQPPEPVEADEPFVPTPSFQALLPPGTVLPETDKQNVIIEKTAKFIASQGAQMEILIKAKQGDNPQFQFLNKDSPLNPYYVALIALVKAGKWPEKKVEVVEEKPPENEDYLHPSLASTIIESAPSIPSIHYKPSADCDYTMLISKMRGETGSEESYSAALVPGEVAPPGTEPLPLRTPHIARPPVLYNRHNNDQTAQPAMATAADGGQPTAVRAVTGAGAPCRPPPAPRPPPPPPPPHGAPLSSTGLSLMKNYNTDSDSEGSDFDDTSSTDSRDRVPVVTPPEEVQVVIDKMALYVSRNGAEFADIVRAKQDPRFSFLEPAHEHHAYYLKVLREKRIGAGHGNGDQKMSKATVSFSIKKLKEPDPILPKPALPYESSSEDEADGNKAEKSEERREEQKSNIPPVVTNSNIPVGVVYKMEATQENSLPAVKAVETIKLVPKASPVPSTVPEKPVPVIEKPELPITPTEITKEDKNELRKSPENKSREKQEKEISRESEKDRNRDDKESKRDRDNDREKKHRDKDTSRKSKKTYKEKRDRSSKSDRKSPEREKRDESRDKKSKKTLKDDLENDIISLEDNDDVMIDLTGDVSDHKVEADTDRCKQAERRRRAAEFLRRVGVDPTAAAALPNTSLASAMVDTLESLRKKKKEEEEKRRKRDKRRHRDRGYSDADKSHRKSKRRKYRSSEEDDRSDYDSKKKKHKKDKKSHSRKRRRRETEKTDGESEVEHSLPPDIDLTSTLKELRNASPTKELGLQDIDESTQQSFRQESSSEDEEEASRRRKKRKEDREYSEGEWSSDSERNSGGSSVNKEE